MLAHPTNVDLRELLGEGEGESGLPQCIQSSMAWCLYVLRASCGLTSATVRVWTVLIWDFCLAWTRGGGYTGSEDSSHLPISGNNALHIAGVSQMFFRMGYLIP